MIFCRRSSIIIAHLMIPQHLQRHQHLVLIIVVNPIVSRLMQWIIIKHVI